MKCVTAILLVGILCALPCSSLAIATDTDTLVSRNIGEVVVVANSYGGIVAPQSISSIQLRKLSSYSVADAVRYFSGVQIKDYGGVGGLKTVDMRSMGSNHLGVFYDGIQVGNAQNGTVDLGRFSLDNIEEVAVYNGQKADIFQSAKDFGTSGSIYLRTRRPTFENDKKLNVRTAFRCGSFGVINPSVIVEHSVNSRISVSANAEFLKANGKYKFRYHKVRQLANGDVVTAWDTVGTRQNGDVEALRIEGGLFVPKGYVKFYYYDSERGIPCAIVRNVWTSSQRQWDRNFFMQGQFQTNVHNLALLKTSVKYSHDYMHYLDPDTTSLYIDNSFKQQSVYLASACMVHLNNVFSADISADWERNWMWSDMSNFPSPVRNVMLLAYAVSVNTAHLKVQANVLGNYIFDKTQLNNKKTIRHTPAVFFSYQLSNCLLLRSFFKRMFRMPTFNDLYYTEIGNISLKPEFATQCDVGFVVDKNFHSAVITHLQVNADAYFNKITDKIIAVPKGNSQYRWMMMNIGKVNVLGGELRCLSEYDFGSIVAHLNMTYTYQKALDYTNPSDNGPRGTYKGQISYIPVHSGSVVSGVEYCGFDLNYSFIYVGERYHVSANIPENYEPSWYTHDLSVAKDIALRQRALLRLSVECNNMLNQQYDVVLNYPMPGRNYKFAVKLII